MGTLPRSSLFRGRSSADAPIDAEADAIRDALLAQHEKLLRAAEKDRQPAEEADTAELA